MIAAIIATLSFSFFFSGIEMAFLSSNKLHIELQSNRGMWTYRILSMMTKNTSHFLSSILIGNTLALVIYGYYMASLLDPWLVLILPEALGGSGTLLVVQAFLSATVVLFLSEFLPKNLFFIKPNFFLSVFSPVLLVIYYVLYPAAYVVIGLTKFFIKSVGLQYKEENPVFGLVDFEDYVKNIGESDIKTEEEIDVNIFYNALYFKEIRVRDCMVPRTEIVALELDATEEQIRNTLAKHHISRVLVYENNIDNIVGYYHALSLISNAQHSDRPIQEELMQAPIATETTLISNLLIELLNVNKSLAVVVDEYGGTSGIITIEDIVEEIFGEINDEYDKDNTTAQQINPHSYLFSARLEIDYLNQHHNLSLPEGDYDTLGGLFLASHEQLPEVGDSVFVSNYSLQVVSKHENRIDKIKLTIKP